MREKVPQYHNVNQKKLLRTGTTVKYFQDCAFSRINSAQIYEEILLTHEMPYVMAINASWGMGKTTFMEMWKTRLQEDLKYDVVLLNAWESDFLDDPFGAIFSTFLDSFNNFINPESITFKNMKKAGGYLLSKHTPRVIEKLTEGLVTEQDIAEYKKSIANGGINTELPNFTESCLDISMSYYKALHQFKAALSGYLKEYLQNKGKDRIIVLIDELDRCRPDYAVSFLEKIKHLFSVEGIVFVVALNKDVMIKTIHMKYGYDGDYAEEYLRRFFDYSVNLPKPDFVNFYYKIEPVVTAGKGNYSGEQQDVVKYLERITQYLNLSVRDVLQIIDHMNNLISYNNLLQFGQHWIPIIVLKVKFPDLYKKYINRFLNQQYELDESDKAILGEVFAKSIEFVTKEKNGMVGFINPGCAQMLEYFKKA